MGYFANCIGLGLVSSIGQNVSEFKQSLYQRYSGITRGEDRVDLNSNKSGAIIQGYTQREKYVKMAEQAFWEAIEDAELKIADLKGNKRVALIVGTSLADTIVQEKYFQATLAGQKSNEHLHTALMGYLASHLRKKVGLKGPVYTISNTCVSGINAIALGSLLIETGQVDLCLVGSVEILGQMIFWGLESLKALSSREELQPFAMERDGIILGEGAGFMVLANSSWSKGKGIATVAGVAITNDGLHLTAPDRNGRGLIEAIQQTLKKADLEPMEIDAIFACGTGTKYNDAMQAVAIDQVWSDNAGSIPVTSVKPLIGHTLGAAGILESISILLMMQTGEVVPIGDEYEIDPEIPRIPLLHQPLNREIQTGILLGSGFSGVNGALVWRKGL